MTNPAKACIFCKPEREISAQNEAAIAVFDSFPVSARRHVEVNCGEAEGQSAWRAHLHIIALNGSHGAR